MADLKISELNNLTGADPILDMLPIVDVSATPPASGSTKRISINNILSSSPTASGALTVTGLVTAGSATITGDLTVDTSTLKVDSANNVVGITNASPLTGTDGGLTLGVIGSSKAMAISMFNCFARLRERDAVNNFAITTNIDTTNAVLDDNTRTSWKVRFGSGNDNFLIQRAAIGSTTFQDLYSVSTTSAVWSDGAGGTRMTLNSTGLGIGTTPDRKLHVGSTVYPQIRLVYTGVNTYDIGVTSGGVLALNHTSTTNGLVLDGSANVGIGITPSAWATATTVWRALDLQYSCGIASSGAGSGEIDFLWNAYYDQTDQRWEFKYTGDRASRYAIGGAGVHTWYNTASTGTANAAITWNQAMTLDASGRLYINTTSQNYGAAFTVVQYTGTSVYGVSYKNSVSGNGTAAVFVNSSNALAGYIDTTNTTVTYNSVSDYRLKELVVPLSGGLARVNALKPSTYKWQVDGSSGEGFIAHELAEVVPAAVSGEKDAVNADGSIKPQGVDLSKVVPILVAAIQELTARVQTLEAR